MVFARILGQPAAVGVLERAVSTGKVHHAYRFEGPEGVGKEAAAFALAQALVCTEPRRGCGACSACRRAVRLSHDDPHVPLHPDVLLLGRALYPPEALGTERREVVGIGVPQVRRVVLSRMGFPPHEGRAIAVIVRAAHELGPEAANALLKTLEEPPPSVHFVLVTSEPARLPETIRSRTLRVRFGPLPEAAVAAILEREGKPAALASAAEGSAARALALADEDAAREREAFVQGALEALAAPRLDRAIAFAEARPGDRAALRAAVGELAQHLAEAARSKVASDARSATLAARRHAIAVATVEALARNAQPALALEAMICRMRSA